MRKNVLIFGLVLGTILCVNMVYMVNLCYTNPDFESNDALGYAAMVLVFSLVFFGIRNYRNKELGGSIPFWKAFKVGLFITLIAASMYVVVWLFYYYLFVPDYLDQYIKHVLNKVPDTELQAKTQEMQGFKEMYKSPFFVVIITYAEVLPVGILVTLISAFFLKKKAVSTVE